MRKTLLAAAMMVGLAPAWAHAQSSNVTLYGVLNLSPEVIINVKQDNTSTTPGTPPPGAREHVSGELEYFAHWLPRHGFAGWRIECHFPGGVGY